ncbi:hypothetical protein WMF27_20590 [Sorangium sp. So ce281]|uniref:hypothetical protein n=1 Tax=unclassified Sorangium TaxID=2621164 RepID=UPI003F5F27A9
MYIVFTSEAAAHEFLAVVDAGLGYPIPSIHPITKEIVGWTTTWAIPMKHPERDEWAIPYGPEIAAWLGDHVPVEIDETWWPPVWIPPG